MVKSLFFLMRKNIYVTILFFIFNYQNVFADASVKQATLSVQGSYSVTIKNDTAIIKGAVVTENIKAQQAVQENAKIIQKIRDNLKQAHINPKKLLSNNYNLSPQYNYDNGKQNFIAYQVIHDISLEIENLDAVGKIADLLTSSGVNQISNIEFTSSKTQEAYNDALKNAFLDAKNKANLTISAMNTLSIGKVLTVNVHQNNASVQPVLYATALADARGAKETSTNFQTKGTVITVHVDTIWEIVNK